MASLVVERWPTVLILTGVILAAIAVFVVPGVLALVQIIVVLARCGAGKGVIQSRLAVDLVCHRHGGATKIRGEALGIRISSGADGHGGEKYYG